MPLWLDEEVSQIVSALVAPKLRVGDVDKVVLEDRPAWDDFKASVFAADEAFGGKGVLQGGSLGRQFTGMPNGLEMSRPASQS